MKILIFLVCISVIHARAMDQTPHAGSFWPNRHAQGPSLNRNILKLWLDSASEHIMHAAYTGHSRTITEFASFSCNLDCTDEYGATPLQIAARYNHELVCKELLVSGAQINHVDHNGNSALMEAASCGHSNIVALLLKEGAETHLQNIRGFCAYELAKRADDFYVGKANKAAVLKLLEAAQWIKKMKNIISSHEITKRIKS